MCARDLRIKFCDPVQIQNKKKLIKIVKFSSFPFPFQVLYGRGSAHSDHKLVIQEVGNEKVVQEIPVERPIVDVCAFSLNAEHYVTVLCEAELIMYKWTNS